MPIATPPLVHVAVESAASGPQRLNETLESNDETPVTVISAESLTAIDAAFGSTGIVSPVAGIVAPSPVSGVVTVVDVHPPISPWEKSKSVAVSDVDERVLPMKMLKQLPSSSLSVRFRPPSKNSAVRSELPTPSCLLAVCHGVVIVPLVPFVMSLAVAQTASLVPASLQSPPWTIGVVPSDPSAPPFQR